MGGKSSKTRSSKPRIDVDQDDCLFGQGEELPEDVRSRREMEFEATHDKPAKRVNKVEARNNLSGSMHSLRSNATMSDASWYTDNSSVRFIEHENYDYPFENVVFEGGGNKGLAYCGAIRELERIGVWKNIKRLAGASAGAMHAVLLGIGYTADEVEEFLRMDLRPFFLDASCGACSLLPNLLKHFGWHPARKLFQWFGERLEEKTGNRNITFEEMYKKYGKEICIIVTNLNQMDVEYCHVKTTPTMPIRLAVRMSMAIPGLFCAVKYQRYGKTSHYVDGGLLCNYPVHCFDGWYLSMKLEDSFLRKLQPLENLNKLWDKKERFGDISDKTLGMMLYSTDEQELMASDLTERVQHEDPPQRPNTKLSRSRKEIRSRKHEASREHALTTQALSAFLRVLSENQLDQKESVSKEELRAVFYNNNDFLNDHAMELFGEEYTVDDVFEYLDVNANGEISFNELMAFAEQKGCGLHTQFVGYRERTIMGFGDFMSTLQDTLLINVKRVFVEEEDIERTLGIDTMYIQTTDFELEKEDKDFLVLQGERAARSYLKRYVRNKNPPLKPELRPEEPDDNPPQPILDSDKNRRKSDLSSATSGIGSETKDTPPPPKGPLLVAPAQNGDGFSNF